MSATKNTTWTPATIEVDVDGTTYSAELAADGAVTIYRHAPVLRENVGEGRWNDRAGEITGCTADLGDEVYDALDMAMIDAANEVE